jgi:hypothetical protein
VRRIDEIADFIRSSFTSIWSLELLLHLKAESWVAKTREQLIGDLRASDAVVSASVASLLAAGLIVEEDGDSYRYAPASQDLAALVEDIDAIYRKQPDAVRRVIVVGKGNLAAFADAFRLRND